MNNLLPIYTIGYGNRSITHFIELLVKYDITQLIDVRSNPFCKFNSDFNRENLQKYLDQRVALRPTQQLMKKQTPK
jgi:uncharacterized protein (DUF488 family)